MTLQVITAATARNLTTLAAVKDRLGISGTDEDAFITGEIARQTGVVLEYLDVVRAQDGTRTLAREVLRETLRPWRGGHMLRLARRQVTAIASIVEDDATLTADQYVLDGPSGIISRYEADCPYAWCARKVVVEYTAGWLLPPAAEADLPTEIGTACIELVKAARAARKRDPHLRSINIQDVGAESYLDPRDGTEGLPASVVSMLPSKGSFGPR